MTLYRLGGLGNAAIGCGLGRPPQIWCVPTICALLALLPSSRALAERPQVEPQDPAGSPSSAGAPPFPVDASFAPEVPFRSPRSAIGDESLGLLKQLELDVASLVGKPDFYVVVGGLLAAPYLIRDESTAINSKWVSSERADRIFELGDTLGNAAIPLGVGLALHLASRESDRLSAFSSDLIRAQILSGALTGVAKRVTDRTRPNGSPYAFPSGHTSTAFAAAGVVVKHYGWGWGALAEAAAVYVGLSRLQENKHYVSDVIGGALLGSYIAYRVTGRADEESKTSLAPIIGAGSYGLTFTARF